MSHHTPSERQNMNPDTDTTPAPGCESFEQTLFLIDGLLSGNEKALAEHHSADCAICGPMVSGWASVSDALFASFEDAAEAAKPDFGPMTDRIIARTVPDRSVADAPAPASVFGRFFQYARGAQAWVLLGATGLALALVIPSLIKTTPDASGEDTPSIAALTNNPSTQAPGGTTPPPVVVVRDLSFGTESNGMVYRTPRGGMTVIWVTENEGA